MWPFKNKKHEIIQVPYQSLVRQAIYDSIFEENAEKIAEMLGLSPVSEDVSELEERDSQERLGRFSALMPFIDAHSDIAAKIAASAYVIQAEQEGKSEFINDTNIDDLSDLFKLVSMSSAVSCISTLMNLGLLETEVVSDVER